MWALRYEAHAAQAFKRLDKPIQRAIVKYMAGVCALDNPGDRGKPLTGDLAGYWRYRIGDYRLICRIVRGEFLISVIELGHRSDIYG